jgi:hypothetical protein
MRVRSSLLGLGLLILVATPWAVGEWPRAFATFAPHVLPQRASGDFDGDGHPDVALIQDGPGASHVLVTLSGSSGHVSLAANVVSLVASDIDHDGDVDLVAATTLGTVLIWLNDGRGHFTPLGAAHPYGLSPSTVFVDSSQSEPVAIAVTAPMVLPRTRNATAVVVTRVRPPTVPPAFALSFLTSQLLRAPPLSVF